MATSQQTINWYNEHAEDYAQHVSDPDDSIYHAYYEKPAIRAELPTLNSMAALSLGCGSGIDTEYLKKQGASRSVGIDISEGLITIAKRTYPGCEFKIMDMEKLDFDENEFDLAYSSLALHYPIGGPASVFKEVYRVLKPGGVFVFSSSHPIETSMERVRDDEQVQDKRLGELKNKAVGTEEDFGDYLTSRAITFESGLAIQMWHQPLSATINQLIEAGLILDKLVELSPTEEMKAVSPRHFNRLKRIPEMVVFKAHKPC